MLRKMLGIKARVIKAERLKFMCEGLERDNSKNETGVGRGAMFYISCLCKTFLTVHFYQLNDDDVKI